MNASRSLAAVLLLGWAAPFAVAEDWNQWRGPQRDGRLTDTALPRKLTGNLQLEWERPHQASYSGPIVCGDLVVTTETVDRSDERVTAYRLADGEVAWTAEWTGSMAVPFFAAANGDWIRSTPACDGRNLVVFGMRDVLVCLNPQTGQERWRVDFPKAIGTPLPAFGAVCSPLIDGDDVYVQTGGAVVKVALADGSVRWKTLENTAGMMTSGAFSSPVIAPLAGVRQLVVQTREQLCGVDLETGEPLWRESIEAFRGMNILTPTIIGDRVFTAAHSGRSQLLAVSRGADGTWAVEEVWSQKVQGYMSSPLVIGETIYLHAKNQRLVALSVSDGAIRWTSQPFGKYWSMITDQDRLLTLDQTGDLLLIEPNDDELQIVDRQQVANDSWAHLAVQDQYLIVRDLAALKVFRFTP